MKEEVLTIDIDITGAAEVKGTSGEALMISFGGNCNCKNFQGKVLPGGVDTQKQTYGKPRTLSARYILDGTDINGQACKIFVENNGTLGEDGSFRTNPKIYTDSKALSYLEAADLTGTITPRENGVVIHVFMEK